MKNSEYLKKVYRMYTYSSDCDNLLVHQQEADVKGIFHGDAKI